jgi:MarR family transcriptional regulator, negative regulator of the multidrug operon emrRAB
MMEEVSPRLANLVGAMALVLIDDMRAAIEADSSMTAGVPSALTTMLAFPGKSLDALRKILGLTPSGAGRIVDRLVAAGLVERCTDSSDRRFISLYVTKRGSRVARRILVSRRAALSRPLAVLTPDERASLEELLYKILYAMAPARDEHKQICRLCDILACSQGTCPVESGVSERKR